MDQTFKKSERLKSTEAIGTLFKSGASAKKGFLILRFAPNNLDRHRIAFSVPKRKVASAVKRNLIKRRMREAFRLNKAELNSIGGPQHYDMILLYLATEPHNYARIESNYQKLLASLHNG